MLEVEPNPKGRAPVKVWDPVVRIGHWALVAAFAVAYVSAEEEGGDLGAVHIWSGYIAGGIVVLRVLWGFVGPRHARFTDFLYSPITALRYLFGLLRGQARRYLGHSPAGAMMVFALLTCVALAAATGWVADSQGEGSPIGELHEPITDVALALIVFHILGVALASFVHRENLVAAMLHGGKRPED